VEVSRQLKAAADLTSGKEPTLSIG